MFMFVFTVVVIGLVGVFLQVIIALGAMMAAQQVGLAQQMTTWHAMAYEYACANPGATGDLTADPAALAGIKNTRPSGTGSIYTGYDWHSFIFSGTYGATPGVRMLATYVLPNESPSGFPASYVGRQLRVLNARDKTMYNFGQVNGGNVRFVTYDYDPALTPPDITTTITITAPPGLPNGTTIMISDARC